MDAISYSASWGLGTGDMLMMMLFCCSRRYAERQRAAGGNWKESDDRSVSDARVESHTVIPGSVSTSTDGGWAVLILLTGSKKDDGSKEGFRMAG